MDGEDPQHIAAVAEQAAKLGLAATQQEPSGGSANSSQTHPHHQHHHRTVSGAGSSSAATLTAPDLTPLTKGRFSSSRDELRYSLRSVMDNMPWFRHLFLVTSGQVPPWLDLTHPRVTLVPHSSIFPDPRHLPTFNSAAIETHLHRIPGLSPTYLVINDDLLLTQPVNLDRFVTPEGAEVMFNAWDIPRCPRGGCRHKGQPVAQDSFGASLVYVDRLYTEKYGKR